MRTADPHAPTKEKLVNAAVQLIIRNGFGATSVDQIIAAAGATKGSFFHFFKSKEDLGKAALERYQLMRGEMLQNESFQKEKDPGKRALGMIDAIAAAIVDPAHEPGCVTGSLAEELAPTRPDFRALCAAAYDRVMEGFVRDLAAAGLDEAPQLADMLNSIMHGSFALIRAKDDRAIGARNLRHFRRYVGGLLDAKAAERRKRGRT